MHSLSENIEVTINLTEKSTASCDYCEKTKRISQGWKVSKNILSHEVQTCEKKCDIWSEFSIMLYSAI